MKTRIVLAAITCILLSFANSHSATDRTITIGSKGDKEGYVLGEILAQLLEENGYKVERKFGLGGTLVCFEALRKGDLDMYPEYSGTLEQAILKLPTRVSYTELQGTIKQKYDMDLLESWGFNNTYALAVRKSMTDPLGLKSISDLRRFPDLRFGFSHEFINRKDGWPGLVRTYVLTARPSGIEHGLAYEAMREEKIDVTDAYSTDGDIEKFKLVLLVDDRKYFPTYLAAPLLRGDLDPAIKKIFAPLADTLTDDKMRRLNAMVLLEKRTPAYVAAQYLKTVKRSVVRASESAHGKGPRPALSSRWDNLYTRTKRHIQLTLAALVLAMAIAIPLGTIVYRSRAISRPIIYFAGLLQTIPSIALLAFMIPWFGIGVKPAIVALFLYALLPILRNTTTALISVDPILKRVSIGMGLTSWQRLRYIEMPLAMPTILAGIKTAAVINIGTATLAAYIGAGGLGEPIVTGLALYDTSLIMEGAIPAAILAIVTEFVFEIIERVLIPRHLLQKAAE